VEKVPVSLVVARELFENRRELWQESKKFARLMRDDTPEGLARLLSSLTQSNWGYASGC
jgi:hypothetical protein